MSKDHEHMPGMGDGPTKPEQGKGKASGNPAKEQKADQAGKSKKVDTPKHQPEAGKS